ncbi:response regulator transcription factor [Streptomyces sp. DH10]|uniref:response regulator transcription factor n=1 Tax=Streptomyces sp. DH10 TaxID=3040121 RepID=UPI0024429B52|nr:response regulator transcription factor [Streptomyces sp. DH10]MDG9711950.1 response regulator transcription factor [Streptomyces sp. DH10]
MRIVIAECSAVLRTGLAHVLRDQGHRVLATLSTGHDVADVVREHRPDAVLLAATEDGVRAVLTARRVRPATAVLCYTAVPDARHAALLFAEGGVGVGYVHQEQVMHDSELLTTLGRLTSGDTVVDPRVVGALARVDEPGDDTGLRALSNRERQVLALMARGRTNSAIAQELHVSMGTVEKHVAAVFGKLGLPDGTRDNRRVLAVLRFLMHGVGGRHGSWPTPGGEAPPVLASVA